MPPRFPTVERPLSFHIPSVMIEQTVIHLLSSNEGSIESHAVPNRRITVHDFLLYSPHAEILPRPKPLSSPYSGNLALRNLLDSLHNLALLHLYNPQQIIVQLLEMPTIALPEHRAQQKPHKNPHVLFPLR